MSRTIAVIAAILLSLVPLAPAAAQVPPDSLDRNGDGLIDTIEQADLDHDGAISIFDGAIWASYFLQHVPGPTPTLAPTPTSTVTPTVTPVATFTNTPTATAEATDTASPTPTATTTSTATSTPSPSPSAVPTASSTPTSPSASPTWTASPSASPTSSPSSTPTPSPVPTAATVVPTATPATGLTETLIAERGDHRLEHEIALPCVPDGQGGMCTPQDYTWGHHGLESQKVEPGGFGSVTAWLVAERDDAQLTTVLNARVVVRRIRMYVLKSGAWQLAFDGLPGWTVTSNVQTSGSYQNVTHTLEADGGWGFALPPGRALHMASNSPTYLVTGATGVAVAVEARVAGTQASSTRWAVNAGADWKAANGDCAAICAAAGLGHFGLLASSYRWYTMLSTFLTDSQVRANPPPL